MDALDRFNDLQRQGFMKPRRAVKAPKARPRQVACNGCLNWHAEGKHTASAAERRANLVGAPLVQRPI